MSVRDEEMTRHDLLLQGLPRLWDMAETACLSDFTLLTTLLLGEK